MSRIFLDWNTGLGDAIICNGLVRELAKVHEGIVLPCKERNLASVRHMFSDLPNVRVLDPMEWDAAVARRGHIVRIGIHHGSWGKVEPFDKAFYEFAGVPFDCRWSSFKVPEGSNIAAIPAPAQPFMLVCDQGSSGKYQIVSDVGGLHRVTFGAWTRHITDWMPVIAAAQEIHCIDSAPLHLVESVPTRGKLFFHRYARQATINVHATLRKPWEMID
jgi:hypothetical protein